MEAENTIPNMAGQPSERCRLNGMNSMSISGIARIRAIFIAKRIGLDLKTLWCFDRCLNDFISLIIPPKR